MLTPQEVHDKTFPRASFGSAGYNMAAVEDFLDVLTEDYSSLYKENAALKAKLKVLAEKIEEYRATEDAMRSTLLDAQRRAAQMVQAAQVQRDEMILEARANAAAETAQLDRQTQEVRLQMQSARKATEDYVARIRSLCQQQMEWLDALPEAHPVQNEAPVVAAPVRDPAPVVEPAQEEPAEEDVVSIPAEAPVEEAAPVKNEEDDFSEAFRRSLSNLKFGRNYNGEE